MPQQSVDLLFHDGIITIREFRIDLLHRVKIILHFRLVERDFAVNKIFFVYVIIRILPYIVMSPFSLIGTAGFR